MQLFLLMSFKLPLSPLTKELALSITETNSDTAGIRSQDSLEYNKMF